jgi:hypothetical protein
MIKVKQKDTLYHEYSEAGALCRSYEQHARTSMSLFIPFATATMAYILVNTSSVVADIILSGVGIIFSIVTFVVIYRVREFNHIANTRAVEIEMKLGMSLYQRLNGRFKENYIIPGNKTALIWLVGIFMLAFVSTLIWSIYRCLQ